MAINMVAKPYIHGNAKVPGQAGVNLQLGLNLFNLVNLHTGLNLRLRRDCGLTEASSHLTTPNKDNCPSPNRTTVLRHWCFTLQHWVFKMATTANPLAG